MSRGAAADGEHVAHVIRGRRLGGLAPLHTLGVHEVTALGHVGESLAPQVGEMSGLQWA